MRAVLTGLACALLLAGCGREDGALRMVTEASYPPYEFLRGREVVGVDVEVCRAVAEKVGRPLRVVNVDFDAVIASVVSGKADLAAAGLTVTEDRRKSVDFSDPYLTTGLVVIYRKADPVLTGAGCKGKRIGVQGGTTSDDYVVRELHEEPERFRSDAEAVVALKGGRCDVVICDLILARNCIRGVSELALSDLITTEEYAIAVRKGRPDLLRAINETLRELKADGRLDRWMGQYAAEADRMRE